MLQVLNCAVYPSLAKCNVSCLGRKVHVVQGIFILPILTDTSVSEILMQRKILSQGSVCGIECKYFLTFQCENTLLSAEKQQSCPWRGTLHQGQE